MKMEIITIGFIVILNIAAIGAMYQVIGNNIPTSNRIAITLVGSIVMYVLIYIIYSVSSVGRDQNIAEAARQLILFTLLPINTFCIMRPIAIQLRKLGDKDIKEDRFTRKLIIYGIIGLIILIVEFMYIKDIQAGIARFKP